MLIKEGNALTNKSWIRWAKGGLVAVSLLTQLIMAALVIVTYLASVIPELLEVLKGFHFFLCFSDWLVFISHFQFSPAVFPIFFIALLATDFLLVVDILKKDCLYFNIGAFFMILVVNLLSLGLFTMDLVNKFLIV